MTRRSLFKLAAQIGSIVGCALAATAPVGAQGYPAHPITLVVPSSAGGPGDVSARLIADRMSAVLGQQIVVENVPGAGGTIGMARVARSEARITRSCQTARTTKATSGRARSHGVMPS